MAVHVPKEVNEKRVKRLTHIVKIAKYYDEDSIGRKLHPDTNKSFNCILGEVVSLGAAMRYIRYTDFKPSWLNTKPAHHNYKTKGNIRYIPNYWNIVTLLVADRLFSDRALLDEIRSTLGDEYLFKSKFVPVLLIKRGVIEQEVENDKLQAYGVIVGRLVRGIIEDAIKTYGEDVLLTKLSEEEYKEFVRTYKEKILEQISHHIKGEEGRLLEGLSPTSDEEIREEFLK